MTMRKRPNMVEGETVQREAPETRGSGGLCNSVLPAALVLLSSGTGHPILPNIFKPESTPADRIYSNAVFVLAITAIIFLIVASLLTYAVIRFRIRKNDNGEEPTQIYGSNQIELAWTVTPVLIVVVLFLATARILQGIEDSPQPPAALEVTAIGHQFWWEFRYPKLGIVTANELHVPVSDSTQPTPTFLTLLSADTDHSFWVPRLAGKTDLIPNRANRMWIDPHNVGVYIGQCAQYCGTQHAKMLLRVFVDSKESFNDWVEAERKVADLNAPASAGRRIFEATACVNCHAIAGTAASGSFGPDLTHLMSRETIASGAAPNNRENLRRWLKQPDDIKPGSLMPAMNLSDQDLDALTDYLLTLR
jgi:cytochrome c oxidase subunit 2